ncbi:Putative tyrosine-protein kinase in cps region [Roseovarius albus]|uniref:Putative tyrosine-protein kinase in cps region n=1 Tax=Roseovarius albus TaxID=1247867 RepID=A0A1X6YVH9_9RHOB|nr:lipopolysaccharide biosynthesis protein [Roseovarius albus]SLN32344.1 Putative tyrosine-protein kinase in cps region [Roseovarius albus]
MTEDGKFYISLFLRRLHYFLLIVFAISATGLTVAYTLPPVYKAEAQLLVESPQIPGDLASSTVVVDASEILQIIKQRILTRANMLDIARDFDVYDDPSDMSADDIVKDMRKRIGFSLPRNPTGASFVTVSFEADNGLLSAQVTNELVTRILEENVSMRQAASGQTLDFFKREVARLDLELADQGQKILEFKLRNKNALPDSLDFRRTQLSAVEERKLQIDRELVSLNDRRTRLEELYEATGETFGSEGNLSDEERRLAALQDQLASALAIYSEQNPKISHLKAQIEVLEERLARQSGASGGTGAKLSPYDLQMADLQSQIDFLTEQRATIEDESKLLEQSIDQTPANAVTLGVFERDYENLRIQYNQATADLAAARTGDQIEAQSRGQRITVIEQAIPPREPTDPNRKMIAAAGVGGGIMVGLGLIVLLDLLNTSIRRPADLSNKLGITPFATIPYIRTRRQVLARRIIIFSALFVVVAGIPLCLYWLHTYYLPMDMMIDIAMDKSGLRNLFDQFNPR